MSSAFKFLMGSMAFIFLWTLLILLLTAQLSYDGSSWASNLATSFQQSIPWIFISPLIIVFSLWFPIIHDRWWLSTALHFSLCIITLFGADRLRNIILDQWPDSDERKPIISTQYQHSTGNQNPIKAATPGNPSPPPHYSPVAKKNTPKTAANANVEIIHIVSRTAPLGIPLYLSIVLLCSLFRYRQEVLQRDQKALRLEAQLTQTQLDLLRSQLQPHFLFNSLNSISSLIHSAPDKADSMIIQLSKLLRCTLDQRDAKFIPLQQEIDTLLTYLDIQSTRFGDRVIVQTSIASNTVNFPVPPMILLPLVENAVRYGVEKTSDPTTIRICSELTPTQLILSITDDGPGINTANETGTGVGLSNTTSRLQTLYLKDSTKVTLTENEKNQTVASIQLPITP